tara:strand:- start:8319 stop:9326 length:1008 start_codon:yes stop_codon:yes gene_type:complete
MQTKQKNSHILPTEISRLLKTHYYSLMASFYETQSSFLTRVYKRYNSIETANIILCFARNSHLEIIRQREKNLNYNLSLENFWENINSITKPTAKITTIVELTGIPKETVRRKVGKLHRIGYLQKDKNSREYSWNLLSKHKEGYFDIIGKDISNFSVFVYKFAKYLNLNTDLKKIEQELKSEFSFYWYHYLSCQLQWLKMWQTNLKDNDLILIVLQTIIPTLQHADKNFSNFNLDNIFKVIGKTNNKGNEAAVSATAIAEVTGIPRATCIRKLEKLVNLGFLIRETKSKRYYVSQNIGERTKNIITKENVDSTIKTFSEYLAIILNSVVRVKRTA